MIDCDIVLEDARWAEADFEHLSQIAMAVTLETLELGEGEMELSILACDDARIAALNTDFRKKVTPTNVLSWPAEERRSLVSGASPAPPAPGFDGIVELGDIAISYDTCAKEAEEAHKPFADHVSHLVVHGMLHLLGYDHVNEADARLMEALEVEILGKMGLDNPYRGN